MLSKQNCAKNERFYVCFLTCRGWFGFEWGFNLTFFWSRVAGGEWLVGCGQLS